MASDPVNGYPLIEQSGIGSSFGSYFLGIQEAVCAESVLDGDEDEGVGGVVDEGVAGNEV